MNCKYDGLRICLGLIVLQLLCSGMVQAFEQTKMARQQLPELNSIVDEVKNAVQTRNFSGLRANVSNEKSLYWSACASSDVEPERVSFDEMARRLSGFSKNVEIHVSDDPVIHRWDFEKPVFYSVSILTEGWASEYPFISFGFKYITSDNRWEFTGVCDSVASQLITKEGKSRSSFLSAPHLPRRGPRIFKDVFALRARIAEIVNYQAFDAIEPYATGKSLRFAPCNLEMMENDTMDGKVVPVHEIVKFLKSELPSTGEVKSSGIQHKTYYETTGWKGEYPFVAFWFSEGPKGWKLTGVSYCKTKHSDLFSPSSPRR